MDIAIYIKASLMIIKLLLNQIRLEVVMRLQKKGLDAKEMQVAEVDFVGNINNVYLKINEKTNSTITFYSTCFFWAGKFFNVK
jgi:hypothetical protein